MFRKFLIAVLVVFISGFSWNQVADASHLPDINPALFGARGFTLLRTRYENRLPIVFTGKNILIRGGIYEGDRTLAQVDSDSSGPTGGTTIPRALPRAGGGGGR